jgi:phosphoserine phosphatase
MSFVLVLLSDPATPALTPALAENVRTATAAAPPRWLMPGVACEMILPDIADPASAETAAREAAAGAALDIAVLPAARRRKRLLLADMDSTIIAQECIDELADMMGLKSQVAAITERAMRGEIDFEPALRERVVLLAGLTRGQLLRVMDERIRVNPGAATLIATMKAHGAHAALVSGGFTLFTGHVAGLLGFDSHRANELIFEGEALTGRVAEPILGREAKRTALAELATSLGLDRQDTLAVGDGANDLAMLEAAGLGVAFRAKPAVGAMADVRIDHGDLTALLFLQGYTADEFAA